MKKPSHVLFGIEYSKRAFILLTLLVTSFTVFAQEITHVLGVPFDLMASARSDTHKNSSPVVAAFSKSISMANQFGNEGFLGVEDENKSPSATPGFPLATPVIVDVVGTTPNDIRVSFVDTNVDEYGYLFYYSTDPDGPFTAEVWGTDYGYGGVENYQTVLAGYEPNTLVYIKVAALIIDPVLQYPVQGSEFTELVSATTMAGWPPPPSDFTATAEGDHIRLTWVDNSPPGHPLDEGEWSIMRSLDGVNFDRVYSVPANVSTFVDDEVTPGVTYVYRLEAINIFGNGNDLFFASATAGNVVAQFYGMASLGGTSNVGTIFKIDPNGDNLTKVLNFNNTNGENPNGSLIQASDGLLYGLTRAGGSIGYGTIFSVNADGTGYTILHNFDLPDGFSQGSLTQASDGSLWGMTQQVGVTGTRNIFRINLDGSGYTVLTRFLFRYPNTPGPAYGSLLQVGDSFFGMVSQGPSGFNGMIFKINTDGSGAVGVHYFEGNDGANPTSSLIQAPDGFIYGTTSAGGSTGDGTIFRLNHDGSGHTVLYNFQNWTGAAPFGTLAQATPTSLVGLTSAGGPHGLGTIFRINTDGTGHTVLYDFDGLNGATPLGDPIVFGNKVFGYTSSGGVNNNGVLFCYDLVSSTYRKLANLTNSIGKNPMHGRLLVYTPQNPVVNTPQEPATNISFSSVLSTSMTVSFTPGDGTNHLAVMRAGSAPTFLPVDDTFYSGDLGNGEFVVYNGTDSTFNVTDLQSNTEYFFTIFEFNSDGTTSRYLVHDAPVASTRTAISTIEDFSLIYLRSGRQVVDFDDTLTLDVAVRDLEKYTIRANVMTEVGSVKFTMDGIAANIENYKPYTLSRWMLTRLSAGVHTLGAQAYSQKNAQGEGFEKREAFIVITNSAAVTQFDLVDKKTGTLIRTLLDGDVINIGQPELEDFDIVARTNITTTESVKFLLNGALTIDNHAPYKLKRHKKIKTGSYTLKATPFVKDYGWGPPGIPLTIHFSVINVPIPSSLVVEQELVVVNGKVNQGSSEDLNSRQVVIFPVPVKDELTISMSDGIAGNFMLQIMDANGATVYTSVGTSDHRRSITIDTNRLGLSSGMYVIYIRQLNGSVLTKRFIKE